MRVNKYLNTDIQKASSHCSKSNRTLTWLLSLTLQGKQKVTCCRLAGHC
jgi:hypothetical protein